MQQGIQRSTPLAIVLRSLCLVPGLVLLVSVTAQAAEIYVAPAPTGNDANAGTEQAPLASMAAAQAKAKAGDTVFFRKGTYIFSKGTTSCSSGTATISGVVLDKDGSAGSPISYVAYPGEVPVFDFDGIRDSCRIKGILVSGDYIHLKGLELKGVRQNNDLNHESWGVWIQGSHNVFEALNVHHIMGAGIFIQRGSDNLVLNCDSHHNLDEHTSNGAGESADGFGCHVSAGETGNVFRGCRAWWNADDGYDFINADAACTVEHSWAWFNGYKPDTMTGIGNGNGFKGGGYGADPAEFPANPAQHSVRYCLAFANKAAGFYANHHPSSLLFYNNTAYGNHPNFNMLGMNGSGGDITVGIYRNNVGLGGTMFSNRNGADETYNSWTIAGLTVNEADFQSVATTGMDAPRQADGSLPVLPNFRLAAGSDLIDKGTDLKFPFSGTAPDLGAFEVGLEKPPGGTGGGVSAAGAGGTSAGTSTGGSPGVAGATTTAGDGGALPGTSGAGNTAAGTPGTVAGSANALGGTSSSGMPPSGAGAASSDAGSVDEAGCSCRAASAPQRVQWAWLPALAFGLLRRRWR
jgi:hypothetical protein